MPPTRVSVYIDGFNLFYGLMSKGWGRYAWLDLGELARSMLWQDQVLEDVRYFTAPLRQSPEHLQRVADQMAYLEALRVRGGIDVEFGYFQAKSVPCFDCGRVRRTFEEKMTDVNIAVALLNDAADGRFDIAILISADSDLVGPVSSVLDRHPTKRVVVGFPPNRRSFNLMEVASAHSVIGQDSLRRSQLPERVVRADGHGLTRPRSWA